MREAFRVSVSCLKHGGALAAILALAGCNGLSQGTNSGPVTGAAAGSTSVNAVDSLQRCSEPLGTLAVDDGRNQYWWGPFYSRTQVTSIEPMVRLVVQQSNCFIIESSARNPAVQGGEGQRTACRRGCQGDLDARCCST
jgi:hypothetical protein